MTYFVQETRQDVEPPPDGAKRQNDTFINRWTSYRTRRDRSLQLKTDPHTYDETGTYNILVKVIDIFGIDTSQLFTVEVT